MMERCDVSNDQFCEQFDVRIDTRFLEVLIFNSYNCSLLRFKIKGRVIPQPQRDVLPSSQVSSSSKYTKFHSIFAQYLAHYTFIKLSGVFHIFEARTIKMGIFIRFT